MPLPIPPPGGLAAPSDDWSDDPSFDFAESGTLPTSSPASSSSRSSRPSTGPRTLSGSPLRQMHLKDIIEDDFVLDDDAFDEGVPTFKSRIPLPIHSTPPSTSTLLRKDHSSTRSTSGSSMKTLTLNATVMGAGPTGIGTITRLGSKGKPSPGGTVKARARALEKGADADDDFESSFDSLSSLGSASGPNSGALKLKLRPKLAPLAGRMPDVDALDDLPDLDDDDQATLKASATLKAKLPPPRKRDDSATIKVKAKSPPPKAEDDDLEDDLVLPLNLTNLTLATQSQSSSRKVRPRASLASTATTATDWDVPNTPSTSGRKSIAGAFSWGDESPSRGRHSETSMTSVSDGPERQSKDAKEDVEGEDYEDGLVLPDPSFFASRNATTLNKILDRKRKQQYAPPPPPPIPQRGDDSFEDGLVFDNPRAELTTRRLEKSRRNRTIPAPFLLGADRKKAEASKLGHPFPPPPIPPSTSNPPGRSGARSPGGSLRSNSGKQRPESPFIARSSSRARRISDNSMPPPPVPTVPPLPSRGAGATGATTSTPATPHRLRSQKSYHNLAPSPSPTLARKQSLASMQDAIASGHVRTADLPAIPALPEKHATSRLTMPTSSSLAKMRPPVNTTFNRNKIRTVEMPRRTKQWGDGTELDGFDDLRVDDDAKSPRSTGSKSPYSTLRGRKSFDRALAKQPPTPTATSFKPDDTAPALPSSKDAKDAKDKDKDKDKKSKRRQRKPALNLIRNLGATDKPKTVGEMTWNPRTSRWEGNEGVLRDFDAVASSQRPALISHFTGSSVASSPLASAPAARIFGDMKFDPEKMCWVSLLPPDKLEPDPFAEMADDEESLYGSSGAPGNSGGGGTIRASGHKLVSIMANARFVSDTSIATGLTAATTSTTLTSGTGTSTLTSASWEDRSPSVRTEMPELWAECREAEERHRREMRGWVLRPIQSQSDVRDRERREEKRLWEVRNLALRS